MMRNINPGELVYVPSETLICVYDEHDNISDYTVLKRPLNLLVTEAAPETAIVGVHYKGKTWFIKRKDIYNSREE